MQLTAADVKNSTLLKSTHQGDVIEVESLGGLHILFLKKKSGEIEMLSSSTSSLRSAALASKKYPHLDIPIIVKSAKDVVEETLMLKSGIRNSGDPHESGESKSNTAYDASFKAHKTGSAKDHAAARDAHAVAFNHHFEAHLGMQAKEKGKTPSPKAQKQEKLTHMHLDSMQAHHEEYKKLSPVHDEATEPDHPPTGMKHKSAAETSESESEAQPKSSKVRASNNLSEAKGNILSAKQKLGKILAPKLKKLDGEEQTRKLDTIKTQKAVRRNTAKVYKQKPAAAKKQYTPPPSNEITRKLPMSSKPKSGY